MTQIQYTLLYHSLYTLYLKNIQYIGYIITYIEFVSSACDKHMNTFDCIYLNTESFFWSKYCFILLLFVILWRNNGWIYSKKKIPFKFKTFELYFTFPIFLYIYNYVHITTTWGPSILVNISDWFYIFREVEPAMMGKAGMMMAFFLVLGITSGVNLSLVLQRLVTSKAEVG